MNVSERSERKKSLQPTQEAHERSQGGHEGGGVQERWGLGATVIKKTEPHTHQLSWAHTTQFSSFKCVSRCFLGNSQILQPSSQTNRFAASQQKFAPHTSAWLWQLSSTPWDLTALDTSHLRASLSEHGVSVVCPRWCVGQDVFLPLTG